MRHLTVINKRFIVSNNVADTRQPNIVTRLELKISNLHTRHQFSSSQFEKCHNNVMLPPRTSSLNLKSLHSIPDKKGKNGKHN